MGYDDDGSWPGGTITYGECARCKKNDLTDEYQNRGKNSKYAGKWLCQECKKISYKEENR